MNKLILSFFALCFVIGINAQSNLQVFSENGDAFYLILNGVRQNEKPETNVKVQGFPAEYAKAKIIFANQMLGEIDKNIALADPLSGSFGEVTYILKTDKKGEQTLKYFSFTPAAQIAPPPPNVTVVQYNTTPMPAPVFGTSVQVTETTTSTTTGSSDNVNMGINMGGFNMGVNVNINDGFGSSSTNQTTTTTTTTTVVPATTTTVVQQPGCTAMNSASFNSLLGSLQAKSWDEDKLTIAKQATSANCLTSAQIRNVMQVFQWEDTRLDYAKFAYAYCLDKQNYYQVNDAFEWDDSIGKLNKHIGN
ncbi:MAG: DUF4476 domain-containing protein [Chitinophagales bacterium]